MVSGVAIVKMLDLCFQRFKSGMRLLYQKPLIDDHLTRKSRVWETATIFLLITFGSICYCGTLPDDARVTPPAPYYPRDPRPLKFDLALTMTLSGSTTVLLGKTAPKIM